MQVATAVAEEVLINLQWGRDFGARKTTRPVLLSVRGIVPTFRFEGGVVVKVQMIDLDRYTEYWRTPHREDWVVTHADVKYYQLDRAGYRQGDKIQEMWDHERLTRLKGHYTAIHFVEYRRFVDGDLERAKKEACEYLATL